MEIVITVLVIVLSIILHEVAHGYAANWLGDPTARLSGRLTLNPISHIDPLGSIIVPLFMFFSSTWVVGNSMVFGWAKPVPYNPYNFNYNKWFDINRFGEAFVAAAGPFANFLLAGIFSLIVHFSEVLYLSNSFILFSYSIIYINILLACFNLIPIPPLDGSKVISSFLPLELRIKYQSIAKFVEVQGLLFSLIFIVILVTFLREPFLFLVRQIFGIFTGIDVS